MAFWLEEPIRSGSGLRGRGFHLAGLMRVHRADGGSLPYPPGSSLHSPSSWLKGCMPCLPLLYTLRRRKKGKGRSVRKLSTPHLSSFQEPTRARLTGDLRVPSLRAVTLLPLAWKPDGKALALREQSQEEGARVPGRRPGGCRPGKGLMSSARIEMMRRCDRAAGLLNPPPSDYT